METWPKLVNPKRLSSRNLTGKVIDISGSDDIKPSIGMLNDKEMVMFTHHNHYEYETHLSKEQIDKERLTEIIHTVMYRTEDGGETWECCGHMPFHDGYEASATVIDGVIYVQDHEFYNIFADHDNVIARIFCSEDKGRTWSETRIDSAFLNITEPANFCLDRNFISLSDNSVAGFIQVRESDRGYTMRITTKDKGKSWSISPVIERICCVPGCTRATLCEAFFFRTPKTNRLMAVSRVDWSRFTKKQLLQIPNAVIQDSQADIDSIDGLMLLESKDEGLTWDPVRGLGYQGMMYPSVLYLNEQDLLLTYTKRTATTVSPYPHMGVQAILGKELEDGSFEFDFEHDIVVIDDRTPDYSENGGGFGITQMLSDGSFITPYSYRVNDATLDNLFSTGEFDSYDLFMRYYKKTRQRYKCPTECHFTNGSFDLRRHLISCFAYEKMETWLKSEVLKWKLEL